MRQKRAKAYRKLMSLYSLSFGFHQPYQVLVDSEMCKTAVLQKVDFVKQLGVVLQGTVKPMITQCSIHELYLQGKSEQPAVDLAKTFERRKCNHREAIPGDECLTSVIGDSNKHRYVLATQSSMLRSNMRSIPAVPIVHVNRSVMILEPPSDATIRAKNLAEQNSLLPSAAERASLPSTSNAAEPPKKKRTGPKGPNPLSVKKKAKAKPQPSQGIKSNAGEKRKRGDDEASLAAQDSRLAEETRAGHKRKRRRKTVGSAGLAIPSDPSVGWSAD